MKTGGAGENHTLGSITTQISKDTTNHDPHIQIAIGSKYDRAPELPHILLLET